MAGPALFWVDNAPYDNFNNESLAEYIPGRFSQHRMKYMAKKYDFKRLLLCNCTAQ
jgi:hypothetical protein